MKQKTGDYKAIQQNYIKCHYMEFSEGLGTLNSQKQRIPWLMSVPHEQNHLVSHLKFELLAF